MTHKTRLSSIVCAVTAVLLLNQVAIGQQLSWAKRGTGSGMSTAALADGSCVVVGLTPPWNTPGVFGAGEPNQTTLSVLRDYPPYLSLLLSIGNYSQASLDLYVAKYGPDGLLQWVRQMTPGVLNYGIFNGYVVQNVAVAAAGDGSFLVCGTLNAPIVLGVGDPNETITRVYGSPGFTGMDRMFLAKYSATGSLEWARSEGGGSDIDSRGCAFGTDGSVFVTGSYTGSARLGIDTPNEITLPDDASLCMFVAKYSATGALTWVRTIRNGRAQGGGVAAQPDGSCLVTGSAWYDVAEQSFPTAGLGEPNETVLSSTSAWDRTNFYAYGAFYTYGALFVAKYATDGSLLWAKQGIQDNVPTDYALAAGLTVGALSDGGGVVTASLMGSITLGAGEPNETTLTSTTTGNFDSVVARYQPTGQLVWARQITSTGRVTVSSANTTADGSTILGGWCDPSAVFGAGEPGETTLSAGGFVARYRADGTFAWAKSPASNGNRPNVSAFADGACIVQDNAGPGTYTFGAGEPNETTIAFSPAGAVFLRLRGETTELSAATEPNGALPVTVAPTNAAEAGSSDVQVTFSEVTASGTTTATVSNNPPTEPLPATFHFADAPIWYEIQTTATYVAPILITLEYDENAVGDESTLRLLHFEGGQWVDITTSLDTIANTITGTTSSLSPFAIVQPGPGFIRAEPTVISAYGGQSTITVNTGGTFPQLTTTAGILLGDLVDLGGGAFSQVLQATPSASGATVTASVPGREGRVAIRFVAVDPMQPQSVLADPPTTYLGGHSSLTAIPRDGLGVPIGPNHVVVFHASTGALIGTVEDRGDGTYVQRLGATALGTAQITVTVDGLALDTTATVTVLDPANLGTVIGVDDGSNLRAYASIQAALNRATADRLRQIYIAPGSYNENVSLKDLTGVTIQGLNAIAPVTLRGIRLDRCSSVSLGFLTVDAVDNNARGVVIAGGQNGNHDITLEHLIVHGTRTSGEGVLIGPNTGAVTMDQCTVQNCGRDGVALAQGGPFTLRECMITYHEQNGVNVDKEAIVTITGCLILGNGAGGDARNGYGILRQRAPGTGTPEAVTLIGNTLMDNHGLVVPGRSSTALGNYDQILDATDS